MVDFSRQQFDFAGDVWLHYQEEKIDPSTYGVINWWGAYPILDVLCHDFMAVMRSEYLYWEHPPISEDEQMDVGAIPKHRVEVLNTMARFLQQPDEHLQELQSLSESYHYLKFKAEPNR